MKTRINEVKTLTKRIHVIVNANSIVQHLIQIKNGIIININASVKSIVRPKQIIVQILAHIFAKIAGIQKLLLMIQ